MQNAKFTGVPVFMDGQKYVVPSLSLRQLEVHYETLSGQIGTVNAETIVEQGKRYVPIFGDALRRNYPEIADDTLFDWVDLNNFVDLILAVRGASGLKAATPGEV